MRDTAEPFGAFGGAAGRDAVLQLLRAAASRPVITNEVTRRRRRSAVTPRNILHLWYMMFWRGNETLTVCEQGTKTAYMQAHVNTTESRAPTRAASATVVVCAFASQRLEQTVDCVKSVLNQDPSPAQMIVVVDHNESLRAELQARLPAGVEVVANEHARGLSSARNTAIARSRGDYVVFIDDDAVAHNQWLARLLAAFDDPEVVGVGGHARPLWETPPPGWLPPEFLWVVGCSYSGLPESGAVRNPLGCNMAFRATLFAAVGCFNPAIGRLGSLPLGCEETEFCLRASRALRGARIALTSGAEIDHRVPAARATAPYLLRRCYFEGISKALVRRLGDSRSLDTERAYLRHALPARLASSVRRAARGRGVRDALGQLAAVIGAVGAAGVGYLVGVVAFRVRPPAAVTLPAGDEVAA
jgi:glucosyl-dolichyl phosphate glucuronosyltransferase